MSEMSEVERQRTRVTVGEDRVLDVRVNLQTSELAAFPSERLPHRCVGLFGSVGGGQIQVRQGGDHPTSITAGQDGHAPQMIPLAPYPLQHACAFRVCGRLSQHAHFPPPPFSSTASSLNAHPGADIELKLPIGTA
jgi:hypothetical protein